MTAVCLELLWNKNAVTGLRMPGKMYLTPRMPESLMEIAQDFLMLALAQVYARNQRLMRSAAAWGSLEARLSDESGEDGRGPC